MYYLLQHSTGALKGLNQANLSLIILGAVFILWDRKQHPDTKGKRFALFSLSLEINVQRGHLHECNDLWHTVAKVSNKHMDLFLFSISRGREKT